MHTDYPLATGLNSVLQQVVKAGILFKESCIEELKELVLMVLPHPVDYYCKAFSIGIATTVFLLAFPACISCNL